MTGATPPTRDVSEGTRLPHVGRGSPEDPRSCAPRHGVGGQGGGPARRGGEGEGGTRLRRGEQSGGSVPDGNEMGEQRVESHRHPTTFDSRLPTTAIEPSPGYLPVFERGSAKRNDRILAACYIFQNTRAKRPEEEAAERIHLAEEGRVSNSHIFPYITLSAPIPR